MYSSALLNVARHAAVFQVVGFRIEWSSPSSVRHGTVGNVRVVAFAFVCNDRARGAILKKKNNKRFYFSETVEGLLTIFPMFTSF